MKVVILVLVAGIAFRMLFGSWPWQAWAQSEKLQKQAQARALLGVSRSATQDEIVAAHRRAMLDAHPDKGGTPDAVHEIDTARDLLLEQTRSKND
ncbi:DnaJ domain-containing protein [Croceicoccus ponticola]|nr:DnaJ domain-containing protein [Croceicoccus ponticola]